MSLHVDYDNYQLVVTVNTHDIDSGEANVADSAPEIRVYSENSSSPDIADTTMTELDAGNNTGLYKYTQDIQQPPGALIVHVEAVVNGKRGTVSKPVNV